MVEVLSKSQQKKSNWNERYYYGLLFGKIQSPTQQMDIFSFRLVQNLL